MAAKMTATPDENSEQKRLPAKEINDTAVRATSFNLKPILVLMALCGCLSLPTNRRKILSTVLWLYKVFLMVIILLYAIRSVSLISGTAMLPPISTVLFLCFQSLGNIVISWKTFSSKYGNFYKTMKRFETVLSIMSANNIKVNGSFFKRRHNIFVIGSLLIFVSGIVTQTLLNYVLGPTPDEYKRISLIQNSTFSPTAPFADTMVSRTVLFLSLNLSIVPYCLPGFFLMTISVMILTTFKALNKCLNRAFENEQEHPFDKLETLRMIHVQLCMSVSHFDKDLCLLYGNIFMWTILEGIMVLYILVKFQIGALLQLSLVYYLVLAFVILASMSIFAALVHEAAHAPLDVIYSANVEGISLDKVTQLNLFLSKLTGSQVGFTTFGLLTITKEFILTLCGVFLTYFTVLYTL